MWLFTFISSIIAWVALIKTNNLRDKIEELSWKLEKLNKTPSKAENPSPAQNDQPQTNPFDVDLSAILNSQPTKPVAPEILAEDSKFDEFESFDSKIEQAKADPSKPLSLPSFNFGSNAFVWIGIIAIVFAAVYFVKFSIDNNLISPFARLVLALIFGGGLYGVGRFFSLRPNREERDLTIAQALIGAALVDFYASFYIGSSLFSIIPSQISFLGMIATTALAVASAIRVGPRIAIIGLIGGFVTPALMSSQSPNASLLFLYLFFVVAGFYAMATIMQWWAFTIAIVIFSYFWVIAWLFSSNFTPSDALWLVMFIIAVCSVSISSSNYEQKTRGSVSEHSALALIIAIVGGLLLTSAITNVAGLRLVDWAYYGFIALLAVGYAYFQQGKYVAIPWLAMTVNVFMILGWRGSPEQVFLAISGFNIIFAVIPFLAIFTRREPHFWAGLAVVSNIIYYYLAYNKAHTVHSQIPHFWGLYAGVLALVTLGFAKSVYDRKEQFLEEYYKILMPILIAGFLSFGTIAAFVELDKEFFEIVLAIEILAIAYIDSQSQKYIAFRWLMGGVGAILVFSQMDDIFILFSHLFAMRAKASPDSFEVMKYAIQAGLLGCASYFTVKDQRTGLGNFLYIYTLYSVMMFGDLAINQLLAAVGNQDQMPARGFLNLYLVILGCGLVTVRNLSGRVDLPYLGKFILGLAVVRVILFEYMVYNPYYTHQSVDGYYLILNFGAPLLLLLIVTITGYFNHSEQLKRSIVYFLVFGTVVYLSLHIRSFYHGEFLDTGLISNAEMYTYSATWLVLGIVLAYFGISVGNNDLLRGSLLVIVLTVGKVFLVDARELEGILRVLSFLGLGVSMLGLGYFYSGFLKNRM